MVQEIAQEIIRSARKKGAQDIYFVPKLDAYELHMRVGDERCKIGCYDFEKFAADFTALVSYPHMKLISV